MAQGPIFLGGLDRSGKTPMRLFLSSHPNIAMTRRTYMWPRFYNRYGDLSRRENFEHCLAAMLQHPPMRFLHPDPERIRREFWQGEPSYARLFALFHQHYAEREGKPRWGDQTGLIERYADPIFAAYPDARMIHMIRDPRDRYEAAVAPAQRRRWQAGAAAARWLYSVGLARRNQQRYPDRYKVVRYETLVSQPEQTMRDICAFLGEEFLPSMLTLEDAMRFTDSGDDSPRQAPEPQATRVALPRREVAFMQAYAGREMVAYGYQLEPIRLSLRDWIFFYTVDWPAHLARIVTWRALEAHR